jgi:hypothetical protein
MVSAGRMQLVHGFCSSQHTWYMPIELGTLFNRLCPVHGLQGGRGRASGLRALLTGHASEAPRPRRPPGRAGEPNCPTAQLLGTQAGFRVRALFISAGGASGVNSGCPVHSPGHSAQRIQPGFKLLTNVEAPARGAGGWLPNCPTAQPSRGCRGPAAQLLPSCSTAGCTTAPLQAPVPVKNPKKPKNLKNLKNLKKPKNPAGFQGPAVFGPSGFWGGAGPAQLGQKAAPHGLTWTIPFTS